VSAHSMWVDSPFLKPTPMKNSSTFTLIQGSKLEQASRHFWVVGNDFFLFICWPLALRNQVSPAVGVQERNRVIEMIPDGSGIDILANGGPLPAQENFEQSQIITINLID